MENLETLRDEIEFFRGLSGAGSEQAGNDPVDPYGLPFEALDEFSGAPLEFEELAGTLWEALSDLHIQACRINRQSPYYQELCGHLEKNIRLLGSMCVTKAVLEQKELSFPSLEGLSAGELYSMVSLHFRKTGAAFRELRDRETGLDMSLFDQICRWAALAERLKATEEKIRKIQSGKISADSMLERAEIFRGEPREKRAQRDPRAIRRASSLPVLGSYARELVREKKRKEAEKARYEREMQRTLDSLIKPFKPDKKLMAMAYAEDVRTDMTEQARRSGGRDVMKAIHDMDPDELMELYQSMQSPGSHPPALRAGPSDETRRKLREQRKKKKKK